MLLTDQLRTVVHAYCDAADAPLGRASKRSLGDPRLLPRLAAGQVTLTLARADRALLWFSDHWPEGADWPPLVPRPVVPAALASAPEPSP